MNAPNDLGIDFEQVRFEELSVFVEECKKASEEHAGKEFFLVYNLYEQVAEPYFCVLAVITDKSQRTVTMRLCNLPADQADKLGNLSAEWEFVWHEHHEEAIQQRVPSFEALPLDTTLVNRVNGLGLTHRGDVFTIKYYNAAQLASTLELPYHKFEEGEDGTRKVERMVVYALVAVVDQLPLPKGKYVRMDDAFPTSGTLRVQLA